MIMQIKLCDRCQRNAAQLKAAAVELQPIAVKPEVWSLVGMDLIGPFRPTPEKFCYVLTVTDYFSKYVEAVPICDKSAPSVARGIYKVYLRHGAPVSVISDQGKEFNNKVFWTVVVCNKLHVRWCVLHSLMKHFSLISR